MLNGLIEDGYYGEDGRPKRCTNCESTAIKETPIEWIDHFVCEKKIYCGDCGHYLGLWAYGSYEPPED